jgi:hypothetical protein
METDCLMKNLSIAYHMGGVDQVRCSIKKLKRQTNRPAIFRILKRLSLTEDDKELDVDIKLILNKWCEP